MAGRARDRDNGSLERGAGWTVDKLRSADAAEASALLSDLIDELYPGQDINTAKDRVKANWSPERLAGWAKQPDRYLYIARANGQRVGFLFTQVSFGVGHVQWLSVSRAYRRHGIGSALVRRCLRDFASAGCYQADVFTVPSRRKETEFFERMGFVRRAVLDKTLLGTRSQYMTAKLRDATEEEMTRRIIIVGDAGQGILLLGHVLASVLAHLGKEVSLNITKPSSVRGGTIAAELCFSEVPVRTPFFTDADILVQLSPGAPPHTVRAKHIIIDEALLQTGLSRRVRRRGRHRQGDEEVHEFIRQAREDLGNPVFTNMIVLGTLLGHIGLSIEKLSLPEELPARFLDENIRAIQLGFLEDRPSIY